MSLLLAILARRGDAELAGLDGRFPWGAASTAEPGAPWDGRGDPDIVATLSRAGGTSEVRVRVPGDEKRTERVIANAGHRLWRRAPWPVNDHVFSLEPTGPSTGALVAGGSEAARTDLLKRLAASGLSAAGVAELTLEALAAAAVVIVLPVLFGTAPLPGEAMAVLASRRVLVTGRADPAFGLEPGLDHLQAGTADEAVVYSAAALEHWDAFATMRAWGALAAARHRASDFYGRLVADLSLEGGSGARDVRALRTFERQV
jgi:hypothetical protein